MKRFLQRFQRPNAPQSTGVGWFLLAEEAGFIWADPRAVTLQAGAPNSAKSIALCPAILDHEARLFEIPCPVDIDLRLERDAHGNLGPVSTTGLQSTVNDVGWSKLLSMTPPQHWRHPNRPILQFITPYRFLSDELVYMTQLPAFLSYKSNHLPGMMLGGRFPIDAWPRPLMWAFEWHDTNAPISLKRGDPWFYVKFETQRPDRKTRLFEAEVTPGLVEFCKGVDSVTNYVGKTFSLIPTARRRRPENLLIEKKR
ncbi:MAG: hypothetical protein AAFQ36_13835 [Pseudomonadota bacterium]